MQKRSAGYLLLALLLMLSAALPGAARASQTVKLAYVEWSSSIASTHVVQAVLQEKLGYRVELQAMEADTIWQAVADGQVDGMLSAWLPITHERYLARFKDQLVDLGPNLKGARIGLVVPDVSVGRQTGGLGKRARPYIKAESIPDLAEYRDQFRRRIVGIDPAAGVMMKTREALQVYGLEDYRLIDGSEVSMTAELSNAIRRQKWIAVTGWTPHWMFARWNLKFLEDPKNVFGGPEEIHTMVRPGLQETMPEVYQFLDRFSWTPEEASQYMIWNQADHGMYPYEKAQRWLRMNPGRVEGWLE
jgi:glycine betaine/proline transport system substrate-binding protein